MESEVEILAEDSESNSKELVVQTTANTSLVRASSPAEFVEKAQEIAKALVDVVEKQSLSTVISGRKHPRVEAWTFLGSMMGAFGSAVYAVEQWTRPVMGDQAAGVWFIDPHGGRVVGWEARVVAQTVEGAIVGAAEAMCTRAESTWKNRDDYALRSMAQTRATSKALRQPLGFLMQLAGYDPTPKEEVEDTSARGQVEKPTKKQVEAMVIALAAAKTYDADIWSNESVLRTASRMFGREITDFDDLTKPEVKKITEGAKSWVDNQRGEGNEGGVAE